MKFTIVSHACMNVETGGKSVLFDPWLVGSCYWRSWWNFPEPSRELVGSLRPDYIYITHLHWDHFHGPSLRLFDRDTTVLVPKVPTTRMVRDLRTVGFRNVREIPHGEGIEVAPGTWLFSYQFGVACADSAVVLTDGTTTLLNANDCKIFGASLRQITNRFGSIDFAFRSHSSASPLPYCVEGYERKFPAYRTKQDYMDEFAQFCEGVGARYAIPFASNHCFLHRETVRYNDTAAHPQMVADHYAKRAKAEGWRSECVVMAPGSCWSADDGFDIAEFDYSRRDEYIAHLLEKYREKLEAQYALEERTEGQFKAFQRYFRRLGDVLPAPARKILPRFGFRVVERDTTRLWVVDFPNRAIEEVDQEQDLELVIEIPALVINDCTRKRMFSAWTPGKRLRVELPDDDLTPASRLLTVLDLFENDAFPVKNLLASRQVESRARRWREGLDLGRAFVKYGVLGRPFVGRDLYASPAQAR